LFELTAASRPLVADLNQVTSSIWAWLAALVGTAKRAAAHGDSLHVNCRRNGAAELKDTQVVQHDLRRSLAARHPGRAPLVIMSEIDRFTT
jgi:hypothetical protein